MEAATGLGLPWRMLRDKLVAVDPDTQLVKYSTTFDKLSDDNKSVSSPFRNFGPRFLFLNFYQFV